MHSISQSSSIVSNSICLGNTHTHFCAQHRASLQQDVRELLSTEGGDDDGSKRLIAMDSIVVLSTRVSEVLGIVLFFFGDLLLKSI
jgi:hypothetical protein